MNINQTVINNFYTTLNDIMMLFLPPVTKHYFIYIYTCKSNGIRVENTLAMVYTWKWNFTVERNLASSFILASSVQNEFETSVSYKTEEDTGNGTDGSDDGNWTCEEEPLKGTDGSRIAAYHAGKATWRCYECGSYRIYLYDFLSIDSSRFLTIFWIFLIFILYVNLKKKEKSTRYSNSWEIYWAVFWKNLGYVL